ncbi:hypothetical protein DFJ73DRAFT_949243 [Zopfochytrium polystomum]|nr:hypothetical protein DFJ73DRAFT_949243 [Zopfochytrium polystomum]
MPSRLLQLWIKPGLGGTKWGTPVGPFGDRLTKAGGMGPTFVDQVCVRGGTAAQTARVGGGGGTTPVGPFGDTPTKAGGRGPTFVQKKNKKKTQPGWDKVGNTGWAVWGRYGDAPTKPYGEQSDKSRGKSRPNLWPIATNFTSSRLGGVRGRRCGQEFNLPTTTTTLPHIWQDLKTGRFGLEVGPHAVGLTPKRLFPNWT